MATGKPQEVTRLLRAWSAGREGALEELFPHVYDELRRMARRLLAGERPGHTLQPTALVHEAFFRLVDAAEVEWEERAQFYCIAAKVMRRVLVDHARGRRRRKRGGAWPHLSLDAAQEVGPQVSPDLVRLDDALDALARLDPLKASIVELRFFGGLSIEETARTLECSPPTVVRHWRTAKAWLYGELERAGGDGR